MGLLVASCSVLYSPDGFDMPRAADPSAPDVTDAGPDAPADVTRPDTSDADAAPPTPNFAPSADLATCEPWGKYQATLTPDDDGHTGGGCRVCGDNGTRSVFSIDGDTTVRDLAVGDVVYGEIWARAAPNAGGISVFAALRSQTETSGKIEVTEGPQQTLATDTWTKLTVTFQATKPAARMDMYVYTDNAKPNQCFVVDDARVERR